MFGTTGLVGITEPFWLYEAFLPGTSFDIIYSRLAPGVLDELKMRNPKDQRGRRKCKHFQWLTENIEHPKRREHLASVNTLMKASTKWDDFKRMLNRALPKWVDLPLFDQIKGNNNQD